LAFSTFTFLSEVLGAFVQILAASLSETYFGILRFSLW